MAQPEKMIKMFSLRSRKGFGSHIFGPDRLIGYNALSYIAECVQTARAHVHYLGLVQTSQGLQEVAEIAADAVEVLEWSNLYYIYKLGNRGFGIFVYSSLNKPNKLGKWP